MISSSLVSKGLEQRWELTTVRKETGDPPPEQQAIRDKCLHPTGTFVEFRKEEVELSIPDRFEEQVRKYPDRLAVKFEDQVLTYDQLNIAANRLAQTILEKHGDSSEPVNRSVAAVTNAPASCARLQTSLSW